MAAALFRSLVGPAAAAALASPTSSSRLLAVLRPLVPPEGILALLRGFQSSARSAAAISYSAATAASSAAATATSAAADTATATSTATSHFEISKAVARFATATSASSATATSVSSASSLTATSSRYNCKIAAPLGTVRMAGLPRSFPCQRLYHHSRQHQLRLIRNFSSRTENDIEKEIMTLHLRLSQTNHKYELMELQRENFESRMEAVVHKAHHEALKRQHGHFAIMIGLSGTAYSIFLATNRGSDPPQNSNNESKGSQSSPAVLMVLLKDPETKERGCGGTGR